MNRILTLVWLLLLFGCATSKKAPSDREPYVLMISFDGFRYDYVEKYHPPHFEEFIKKGVAAESMIPSFPSKTFPNHYSIITGRYPGNHGLVDNNFFAPDLGINYKMSNPETVDNPDFYGCLPHWPLVRQNKKNSASFFWVGSETKIHGMYPNYWLKYDDGISNEERIQTVIQWLTLPKEKRPRLVTLYFSLVDHTGHENGPESAATGQAVLEADRLLGRVLSELEKLELDIDVIVTSDHGMMTIEPDAEHLYAIENLVQGIDPTKVTYVNGGTLVHFYCTDEMAKEDLYDRLKRSQKHFTLYRREEIPASWHYRNERVGDLILNMDPGYYMRSQKSIDVILATNKTTGVHGYDPYATREMHAIFYARGPQIAVGKRIPSFENVNIYPFVAALLGITDLPEIDGKLEVLQPCLRKPLK